MNTKKKILDVALTLFSERGYGNVFVSHIAEGVGIKAPSLYKHYKSKQDIFDAILAEMKAQYSSAATNLNMNGNDSNSDGELFSYITEDRLVEMGIGLFKYFLHDEYQCKFRKMLTIEQFKDKELGNLYTQQYIDAPLLYQSGLFEIIVAKGALKGEDTRIMALQFYAPIYTMLTLCDREPGREEEAEQLIDRHIRQFNTMYGGGNK